MCPRCGSEGTLIHRIVKGYPYLYVRHYDDGKPREHLVPRSAQPELLKYGENLIPYMGDDSHIAPFIISLFPQHRTYVEVFGGGASVLLKKPIAPVEVYNDLDNTLVNLFMCVARRDCLAEMIRILDGLPFSRVLFNEVVDFVRDLNVKKMPDPQSAALLFYVKHTVYSGSGIFTGASMRVSAKENEAARYRNAIARLKRIHRRLKHIVFECRDWRDVLRMYDRDYTLFYLDPPHHNNHATQSRQYYRYTFTERDYTELLDALAQLRGRFVLKYLHDKAVEDDVCARGFNYIVVGFYASGAATTIKTKSQIPLKRLIFAYNYETRGIKPTGYVKQIIKTARCKL